MIDVLVAGGGPAGLAAAICCAQAGLSVTVAEPRVTPIDKACGEGVMPAALRRLTGLGVDPGGYPLRGIRYLDEEHRADALFRHGPGRGVRRTTLHAALTERAAALGITFLPVRVTSFAQHAGHVSAAGLQARYLVAADGLHSGIRRAVAREPGAGGAARNGHAARSAPPRYGLRQHFRLAPWTDLVEVYWTPHAEAYVTPVAGDLVGIGLLFARPDRPGRPAAGSAAGAGPGPVAPVASGASGEFTRRLASFPALADRLGGAAAASDVRGAGPMRQDVRRRVYGRVLLVGDASGYLDALTGEGIGVGVAQAEVLAECIAAGRPGDYERAWRRVSGPAWRFTAGLLWSRNQPLLAGRIVTAAQHLPRLFTTLVNHAADALPGRRTGDRGVRPAAARPKSAAGWIANGAQASRSTSRPYRDGRGG